MAVTATPIFAQTIKSWATQFVTATSTTKTLIAAGGTNGSQITSLTLSSTDTAAMNMLFFLYDGTTYHQLMEINIPANSGNASNATPPVDAFRNNYAAGLQVDAMGNKILNLPTGWSLYGSMAVAITAAKAVEAIAQGGDY
jgi:hypothetical protein